MSPTLIAIVSIGAVILFFCLIYIFLAAPKLNRKVKARGYTRVNYAHRGLHDATRAENSLAAFSAAVEKGYGIELDVRLSLDGELVVFHDGTLDRMTEASGRVDSKTISELKGLHLGGSEERIPTLSEVLSLVDGRVPLLVEIKEDPFKYCVTEKTAEVLREYRGEYIVESFNPLALRKFKKLMPDVIRGQLADNYLQHKKYRSIMYFFLQFFMLNFLASPDFISYNHEQTGTVGLWIQKRIFRAPIVAWTVHSREDEERARKFGFDGIIFEDYAA